MLLKVFQGSATPLTAKHILQVVDLLSAPAEVGEALAGTPNGVGRATTVKGDHGGVPPQGSDSSSQGTTDIAGPADYRIAHLRPRLYVPEHRGQKETNPSESSSINRCRQKPDARRQ